MHPTPAMIAITGILMPLLLVPIAMSMRLRMRRREWEHLERMKSLDLGFAAPQKFGAGGVAAIGAGVPTVAFVTAFLTTLNLPSGAQPHSVFTSGGPFAVQTSYDVPMMGIIWTAAVAVSLFALMIALILGVLQVRAQNKALQSNSWSGANGKPAFDAEAYEFAGR